MSGRTSGNGAEPLRVPKHPLRAQGFPDGFAVAVLDLDEGGYIRCGDGAASGQGPNRWPSTDRQPHLLETVWPGIFAAGDVRAGATKRVAGAVGDGALAVRFAHQVLQG